MEIGPTCHYVMGGVRVDPATEMSTVKGLFAAGEVAASTTNRNFNGRMGKGGMVHLMSPATAAETAVAGVIKNSGLYKGKGGAK